MLVRDDIIYYYIITTRVYLVTTAARILRNYGTYCIPSSLAPPAMAPLFARKCWKQIRVLNTSTGYACIRRQCGWDSRQSHRCGRVDRSEGQLQTAAGCCFFTARPTRTLRRDCLQLLIRLTRRIFDGSSTFFAFVLLLYEYRHHLVFGIFSPFQPYLREYN